jgi:hypothetical protein
MTTKIRVGQFSGLGKLFSREPDGLSAILRGLAIDNARLKIEVAGVRDFTDNSGGTPTPILMTLPTTAIDATSAGGAQTTALSASLVKIQNAGKVITNTVNVVRSILGLSPLVSASGTQATADTIPAQDLASTAATGNAAASFASAVASFQQVAFNMQALVNGANEVIAAIDPAGAPMFRAYNERFPYVGHLTLAAIPAVISVAAGPGALAKADADAFLFASARDIAALAYAWNAVMNQGGGAGVGPLHVIAG